MYKVLIVDDESFIRERLKTMIPWHEYGLEVTGLAEDGESALRLMERKQPDIVICDVRMPDMTGLDMIGKAILLHPDVHYIILSAYGEFGLVKKAMQLGVADYLLKPTQPDELLEVIMKLVDRLDLSRRKKERDALTLSYLEAIRAQCIHELILGNHPGYGWEDECVNVGLEWLTKGNLRLLLICMDRLGFQKDLEALKTAQFAVQNVMYELVSEHQAICPVRLSVGRWLLAVGEGVSDEWLLHFSGTLRDSIARYTKLSIHIMISEPGEHVLDLGRLFWETEKTMDYLGQDPVHPVRFIQPSQKELAYGYWSKPMQELIRWIADGRTESIDLWLRQLGTSFLSWDLESAQKWCFEWLLTLSEHLQHEGQDERCAGTDGLRMQIASQYRNKELLQFFGQEIHKMIKRRHGSGPHQLIKKAMEFIEKNFDQDIHLATVAEELCLSPVYLSEFFKNQTGVTFRSYLLQVRMAEAVRLLKDPTVKVYEVAYRVGYGKVEHFVKLFKRQYGMTPSEYRGHWYD